MLSGEHYDRSFIPAPNKPKPDFIKEKELILAENHNCKRVFAYLCSTRGLDYALISELVHEAGLLRSRKQAMYCSNYSMRMAKLSVQKKLVHLQNINSKELHQARIKAMALKSCMETVKSFFFESAIDLLSYLQMHDTDDCRLISMMGVKPNIVLETMDRYNYSS